LNYWFNDKRSGMWYYQGNKDGKGVIPMARITSAIATKQFRKLNDQSDVLLAMEKKSRAFTAAIQ